MVTNSADVLELFGLAPTPVGHPPLGPAAGRVLGRLGEAPASVDELGHALELDAGTLAAALSELELHGLVDGAAGIYRACTSGPRPPPAA
jgi:predicted Rossmann fold nucleotide-binding protein DprA/Smf involved in DNA uptake